MPAVISQTDMPGLYDVVILTTGETLRDLTTGQVVQLIAQRGLIPA